MRCSWCDLPLNRPDVAPDPYRCVKCQRPMCSPVLRDCGFEHWKYAHTPRKVVETRPL